MRRRLAVASFFGCLALATYAGQPDPLAMIERAVTAARQLTYTGTFVYQSGHYSETSRIFHLAGPLGEQERIEVLDGTPREVVRRGDEVKCYIPEKKLVIVETRPQRKVFPALLPAVFSSLTQFYEVRMGKTDRVAGLPSRIIMLRPKDGLRYGHWLWTELSSGLLLKATMVNENNEPLEQFSFTQLQIGGPINQALLEPSFIAKPGEWDVRNTLSVEEHVDEHDWEFRDVIPGFQRVAGLARRVQRNDAPTMHVVFSDGLAAISVFIEPLDDRSHHPTSGVLKMGSTNVYKRIVDGRMLTVLGEVPLITLKRLGDGMVLHKSND